MAYGRNYYPDQQVFIGEAGDSAEELKGVQSFEGSWSIPYEEMQSAGNGFVGNVIQGQLLGEVSISRFIVQADDPMTGFFETPLSGYLIYGPHESYSEVFNFGRAYIDSYSSSCSLGAVATADFTLTAYGSAGKMNPETRSYSEITPTVATADNISITTPFGGDNAIQSYDLGIAFARTVREKMGADLVPVSFLTTFPIVVSLSFTATVNEYELQNLTGALCSGIPLGFDHVNLQIDLNTCEGAKIRSFSIPSGRLISSSLSAGIGSDMEVSMEYQAEYNSIGDVEGIFS